ncbi:hypothetical protein SAMN05880501_104155 [Ureibacillus xyleni]|uniref:PD-(D/E)XK nuclease superfamily protein n=1 Tax=Ureibacillus xyleni TaxID=614648 RepID=A0A285SDQ0_9BACL|nr:hypothetical protein [Ureibacillus xyleni]SOC05999.1 hypothetical protein SAMN05880501_104155 [Ureibacillus xyleni]
MKHLKANTNAIHQFRNTLIIDKYDPQIVQWGTRKFQQDYSESIEDALIWNVFRSLRQIHPELWVKQLFAKGFQKDFPYSLDDIEIYLWKRVPPPRDISQPQSYYELDIVIETKQFVWFLLAKYKSDVRVNTQQNNQIIRNVDVGLEYTKQRDFYFSLLFLDPFHTPYGQILINQYRQSEKAILQDLPHRTTEISRLGGISIITWKDVHQLLKDIYLYNKCPFERFISSQASDWLIAKILEDD